MVPKNLPGRRCPGRSESLRRRDTVSGRAGILPVRGEENEELGFESVGIAGCSEELLCLCRVVRTGVVVRVVAPFAFGRQAFQGFVQAEAEGLGDRVLVEGVLYCLPEPLVLPFRFGLAVLGQMACRGRARRPAS